MTAPRVMIAHFPPRWSFIYSHLPLEMVVSNVVSLRGAAARLLVPHASFHTSGLINTQPEALYVRDRRAQRCLPTRKLAQLRPVVVKAKQS